MASQLCEQPALCGIVLELGTQLGKGLNPQTLLLALQRATAGFFPLPLASLGIIPWEQRLQGKELLG